MLFQGEESVRHYHEFEAGNQMDYVESCQFVGPEGKDYLWSKMDKDGNVLKSEKSVLGRWNEYSEDLMNVKNERKRRMNGQLKVSNVGEVLTWRELRSSYSKGSINLFIKH